MRQVHIRSFTEYIDPLTNIWRLRLNSEFKLDTTNTGINGTSSDARDAGIGCLEYISDSDLDDHYAVVTWYNDDLNNSYTTIVDINGNFFLQPNFTVATYNNFAQKQPIVMASKIAEQFFIVWDNGGGQFYGDGSGYGLFGKVFDYNGHVIQRDFIVNYGIETVGDQVGLAAISLFSYSSNIDSSNWFSGSLDTVISYVVLFNGLNDIYLVFLNFEGDRIKFSMDGMNGLESIVVSDNSNLANDVSADLVQLQYFDTNCLFILVTIGYKNVEQVKNYLYRIDYNYSIGLEVFDSYNISLLDEWVVASNNYYDYEIICLGSMYNVENVANNLHPNLTQFMLAYQRGNGDKFLISYETNASALGIDFGLNGDVSDSDGGGGSNNSNDSSALIIITILVS